MSKSLLIEKPMIAQAGTLIRNFMKNEMSRYRHYNIILLGGMACFFGLLCCFALWMDPLDGDLTRVGGFLENDFGWNKPQEVFEKPLFQLANSLEEYNLPFQIVVFGDSFSMNKRSGWQNYFVAETRKSVFTVVSNLGFVLADLLQNQTFRETPPDFLVYEVAERNLLRRTNTDTVKQCCNKVTNSTKAGSAVNLSFSDEIGTKFENRAKGGLNAFSLDTATDFVRKSILKIVFGDQATDVRLAQLKCGDLFSNRRSDELLYFDADLKSGGLSERQRLRIKEQLRKIQERVESNGKTKFVLLVAPNKLTTYWDYLTSTPGKEPVIIKELRNAFPEETLPMDQLLKSMVAEGIIDVFLPNNTHWGSAGHKATANALILFLSHQPQKGRDRGIL